MQNVDFEKEAVSFEEFFRHFAPLLGRREAQQRGEQYLRGLLEQQKRRRNAANLAESIAGASPRALQRFLTESPWETQPVIERLQAYAAACLSTNDGVFVILEAAFPKQGMKSVGVARQAREDLRNPLNCQIGIFLGYASSRGFVLLDKRLYLPRFWTKNHQRRRAAGVPESVEYQTKEELALSMLRQAKARGLLEGRWVTGVEEYEERADLGDALDLDGWSYLLETDYYTALSLEQQRRLGFPKGLKFGRGVRRPLDEWWEVGVEQGSRGWRVYQVATTPVTQSPDGGPKREHRLGLLRNRDDTKRTYFFSNASKEVHPEEISRVAALHDAAGIEFEVGKTETGLDEYEVRGWAGWHHHITLALLAGVFMLQRRHQQGEKWTSQIIRPPKVG